MECSHIARQSIIRAMLLNHEISRISYCTDVLWTISMNLRAYAREISMAIISVGCAWPSKPHLTVWNISCFEIMADVRMRVCARKHVRVKHEPWRTRAYLCSRSCLFIFLHPSVISNMWKQSGWDYHAKYDRLFSWDLNNKMQLISNYIAVILSYQVKEDISGAYYP